MPTDFTDDEIEFLRTELSPDHAKVAEWHQKGFPGVTPRKPDHPPTQAEMNEAVAEITAIGARYCGVSVDRFKQLDGEASTFIWARRYSASGDAAKHYGPGYLEDFPCKHNDRIRVRGT